MTQVRSHLRAISMYKTACFAWTHGLRMLVTATRA